MANEILEQRKKIIALKTEIANLEKAKRNLVEQLSDIKKHCNHSITVQVASKEKIGIDDVRCLKCMEMFFDISKGLNSSSIIHLEEFNDFDVETKLSYAYEKYSEIKNKATHLNDTQIVEIINFEISKGPIDEKLILKK